MQTQYKLGDSSPGVMILQTHLNTRGYPVAVDCHYGPATAAAVKQLQRDVGLMADGIVGPKTYEALQGNDISHFLTQDDIAKAADTLDVDIATIMAVKHIEGGHVGFLPDGRVDILYERHVMLKRLKASGVDHEHAATRFPNLVNPQPGGYKGAAAEHYRLNLACGIDRQCAFESCSWGLFQIMGYHWKSLGYASIDEFVSLMRKNEGQHLNAFCRFITAHPKLHQALKERDWTKFARGYNGPGYKKNKYDSRLAAAYKHYNKEVTA